jgi:hypothetical protein
MRALNEEIATLETLTDGRYNYVFRAAVKLGQHVGGGWLARSVVDSALETACHANGLVKKRGIQAVRTQIDNGLERGIAEPRTMAHIDEDVARQEAQRGSSRRPPQPSEPEGASSAPIALNIASGGDTTSQMNDAPFPLPAIRDTYFAWRHYDGRPWLCTAQQKSKRDRETGEEIMRRAVPSTNGRRRFRRSSARMVFLISASASWRALPARCFALPGWTPVASC